MGTREGPWICSSIVWLGITPLLYFGVPAFIHTHDNGMTTLTQILKPCNITGYRHWTEYHR
jgi:hypothetical protein